MAKKFGGFTPQQQQTLLSKMGYDGPAQQDDMNKFMMSSPKAASMMGKYTEMAKARVEGGPQMAMQIGGLAGSNLLGAAASTAFNSLSANKPNTTGGFAMGAGQQGGTPQQQGGQFNSMEELMEYQKKNPTANLMGEYQRLQQQAAGQQGQGNTAGTKGAGGYASADMQPIYDDAGNIIGYGPSVYQPGYGKWPGDFPGPIIKQPVGQPIEGGPETPSSQKGGSILKTPQGNFTYTGRTVTQADGTPRMVFTIKDSTGRTVGTDLTSADFYKWTQDNQATAEKIYDPSQGLPEPVGTLYTDPNEAMDAAFESDFNADTEGTNQNLGGDKTWAKSNVDTLANVENPKDYTLRLDGKYWTLVYPDGTEIKTGHKNKSYATGRGNILAAAADATRNVVTEEEKTAAEQQYEQQLEQYQQYQSGEASALLEDPQATYDQAQSKLASAENLLQRYTNQLANMDADDPQRSVLQGLIDEQQVIITQSQAELSQARSALESVGMPSTTELRATALEDPESLVTKADVVTTTEEQRERGMIDEGTGQAPEEVERVEAAELQRAATVSTPDDREAATYEADTVTDDVKNVLDTLEAATGKPGVEAIGEAQTMDPEQLASLGLTVEQIDEATQVVAPEARELQTGPQGELIEGATVDMAAVEKAVNFEAATGVPSSDATVQGQLTGLLEQFEGGETPPWAAGAMRAATATLAARGLAASSMAGQAVVQAAMESALPIAQADAATRASFEAQNLSNRQQTAMFAAEQRAKFLNIKFDQEFQTRVMNASKISDIANMNFTAEQQIALENARLAQTVDLENLNAANAKILADAGAMVQVDLAGLSNNQQMAVRNADAFLQMDMKNLDNTQQTSIFKAQQNIQSLFTDQAALNAAEQFNATSINQTNQFYDGLDAQVEMFNAELEAKQSMFEAEQENAIALANASEKNARDQFNASSGLVVAQANAAWDQAIATTDNAAQNQANRDSASAANGMTETTYNNMLQQERDALDYAVKIADREDQQEHALVVNEINNDASASAAKGSAVGTVVATVGTLLLKKALG